MVNETDFRCPVCGYPGLSEPAWDDDDPSDQICPSCGIQFGYDDGAMDDSELRRQLWQKWRERWIENGCKWWSNQPPPAGWDPTEQLENAKQL